MVFLEKMKKSLLLFSPRLQPIVCKAWSQLYPSAKEGSRAHSSCCAGSIPASPAGIPSPFPGQLVVQIRGTQHGSRAAPGSALPSVLLGCAEDAPKPARGEPVLCFCSQPNKTSATPKEGKEKAGLMLCVILPTSPPIYNEQLMLLWLAGKKYNIIKNKFKIS